MSELVGVVAPWTGLGRCVSLWGVAGCWRFVYVTSIAAFSVVSRLGRSQVFEAVCCGGRP
jgi:hypothetical protein